MASLKTAPTAPTLGTIERTTLNDHAYNKLKGALLAGRIEPGMSLTFRQLAQDLGTSMMPVREAVARLVAERALEVLPQRGIRVPVLTAEELDDLWNLRAQLEGEAAARAAVRATNPDLNRIGLLRDRVRESAETGLLHEFLEANSEFQFAIYEAAQTRVFIALVETLRIQSTPYCTGAIRVLLAERPPFFDQTLRYHDELVEAIAHRDALAARKIKQADIQEFRALFDEVQAR